MATTLADLIAEAEAAIIDERTTRATAVRLEADDRVDEADKREAKDAAEGARMAATEAIGAAVAAWRKAHRSGSDEATEDARQHLLGIARNRRHRAMLTADPDTDAAFARIAAEFSRSRPSSDDEWTDTTAEPEWPPLQPLAPRPDLPTWPVDVLPAWMADHVVAAADQLQTPIDLCAQFALGAVSAAAMGHARVVLGGRWSEPLNLYLATALHSGGGKSPAEKAMTRPLRAWEAEARDASLVDIREAEIRRKVLEKRYKELEVSVAKESKPMAELLDLAAELDATEIPTSYRLLADDATPEALVMLLARHGGRLAVLSTEAELLDMAAGAYSGDRPVNVGVYLKAYSGDTIMVDRKGNGTGGTEIRIDEPLLTVSLAMQPTVIDFVGKRNSQLEGRGFLARFLYAYPESMVGHRDRSRVLNADTSDATAAAVYGERLTALAAAWAADDGKELHLDAAASELFVAHIQGQELEMVDGGRLVPIGEWMAKLQSAILRVSGLLHLADGRPADALVDASTVARAIALGDYWIEHALSMAVKDDGTANEAEACAVLTTLARLRLETFKPRDLWTPLRTSYHSVEHLVPVLQKLEACGYLTMTAGSWGDVGVRGVTNTVQMRPGLLAAVREKGPKAATEGEGTRGTRGTAKDTYRERVDRRGWQENDVLKDHSLSVPFDMDTSAVPRVPRVLDDDPIEAVEPEPVDNSTSTHRPAFDVPEGLF